jgi:sec-independent protein translocase protein TatA
MQGYSRSAILKESAEEHPYQGNCSKEEDMLPKLGPGELLIIFLIILLIFGASRLRDIGGAMGGAIRDFRNAVTGPDEEQGKGGRKEEKKET